MNIVTFSSVWGSVTGGIDVFNKELVKGFASTKKSKVKVCVCLLKNTSELKADSESMDFHAITPDSKIEEISSAGAIGHWGEAEFSAVRSKMWFNYEYEPDIILLHDIFCKELLPLIREAYSNAKIVTFFHSAYGRSEKYKGRTGPQIDQKEKDQREMLQNSDLAISVGSFAKNYLHSLDVGDKSNIDYILPGLPAIKSRTSKSKYFNAMSFGRLNSVSDSTKKISISANAWAAARASNRIKNLDVSDVKFFAIGSTSEKDALESEETKLKSSSHDDVRVLPYEMVQDFDTSDLKSKMESCAFILLNSLYENFGLTYLEACTFGTPSIISENSGFFHDLKELVGEEKVSRLLLTVPTKDLTVPTKDLSDEEIEKSIVFELIASAGDYDKVFRNAQELSSLIQEKWPSWEKITEQLLSKFESIASNEKGQEAEPLTAPNTPIKSPLKAAGLRVESHQEKTEPPLWEETVGNLSEWCWKQNATYRRKMLEKSDIESSFDYPLTQLQMAFWEKREELIEHRFKDLILSGGTSSGKTTLAEHLFGISRPNEFARARILYIAPTKALAQERAKAWKEIFPSPNLQNTEYDPVIVSTGDNNASDGALMRGDFNIACTVYEKANVILSASQDLFKQLNMVVIDEFHMIEDLHRGNVLECLLAKIKLEKASRIDGVDETNHLRIVIITTEKPSETLENFLTFHDYDLSEDIRPLALEDSSRAKAVTHKCIAPGWVRDDSPPNENLPAIFDIKTFDKADSLSLSKSEAESLGREFEKFRSTLTHASEQHSYDQRGIRREYYKEFIEQWIRQNLRGQRLLVFMNSKYETIEVAKFIKNTIRSRFDIDISNTTSLEANEKGIDSTVKVISEIEQTDFTKALKECAEEGVFIHNADVAQKARESIEGYLGQSLPTSCRSEIIFATQTLSFGVNLKVTDVAFFNVLFPTEERVQTGQPNSLLLSRCNFANMAGRAGRLKQSVLGRPSHVYWYLDPEKEVSFESALAAFYVKPPKIRSHLFYRSDARTLAELNKLEQYHTLQQAQGDTEAEEDESKAIQDFSYPFSRSVLDGVRFLGGTEREVGFLKKVGCTDTEVNTHFFLNTIYYSENCEPGTNVEDLSFSSKRTKKGKDLASAVKKVIKSAAHPSYSLIQKPISGGYQITPLGCSTIDTGTEIATVIKLRSSLLALNKCWSEASDIHLPFVLAILPLFFQPEVYRQHLARLPEIRLPIEWNAAENRSDLISRAVQLLTDMQVTEEKDRGVVNSVLDGFMNWVLINQPVIIAKGRYEGGAQDGCLRLFVAFLAWVSGRSQRKVIGEIQRIYPSSGSTKVSPAFNFESFSENLTWKVLFLISLMRASKEEILPASSTFNAVRFVHRSRFGCTEKAIPLLFKNKHGQPPLNRVKVHELLKSGYSVIDIATHRNLDECQSLTKLEKREIKNHVRTFIKESFQEVSRQFSCLASGVSPVRKANEEVSEAYWSFSSKQIQAILFKGSPTKNQWSVLDPALTNSLATLIKSDEKEEQFLIRHLSDGVELQIYSSEFDGSDRISVQKSKEYQAYFSFGNSNELGIPQPNDFESTIVVDFSSTAGKNSGASEQYCCVSPAAFGIILSLCARSFVADVDDYLKSIISNSSNELIGTKKLYTLSESHLQNFPEPLFEAWAKYIEVGEF